MKKHLIDDYPKNIFTKTLTKNISNKNTIKCILTCP